jgi:uncharacterized membrane-anchored protein
MGKKYNPTVAATQMPVDWAQHTAQQGFVGGFRQWVSKDIDAPPPPQWTVIGEESAAARIIEREVYVRLLERVPRYPWLRWLFNLISVEKKS